MAAITSAGTSGNWSATGTWSGAVVPGNGDTVTFADATHDITVDVDTTVGSSPSTGGTAAIDWGTPTHVINLVIATGKKLTVRGDLKQAGSSSSGIANYSAITLGAGSSLIFDPASGQQYIWYQDRCAYLVATAPTSGSHATVKTDLTRASGNAASNAVMKIGAVFPLTVGLLNVTYTDFVNFGTATDIGIQTIWWNTADARDHSVTNCTFTGCGYWFRADQVGQTFTFDHNIASSSVPLTSYIGISNPAFIFQYDKATTHSITFSSFDSTALIVAGVSVINHDNFYGAGYIETNTNSWPDDTYFYNNFLNPTTNGPNQVSGSIKNCYMYGTASNQHFLTPAASTSVTGVCFEFLAIGGGDCILPPTGALTVKNCFNIAGATGYCAGALIQSLAASGLSLTFEHNLTSGTANNGSGGHVESAMCSIGESGGAFTGMMPSCQANVSSSAAVQSASFVDDVGTPTLDAVTVADYNFSNNPGTHNCTASGSTVNGVGYNTIKVTAAGAMGAGHSNTQVGSHDQIADPQWFDPAGRNISQWSTHVGGAGTDADALARLAADPSLIATMMTWIRAGYAPTNIVYRAASYPADTSATDANGTSWPGGLAGVGPMAYVSATTAANDGPPYPSYFTSPTKPVAAGWV